MFLVLLAVSFGASTFCSAAPVQTSSSVSRTMELFMPDLEVKQEDAYMCLPLKMSTNSSVFITGFEPKADMSISHHILLYGCEEAGDESGKPFSCTQMDHASADAKPTCAKGNAIIYAWAMGAPSFQLPKDVAFKAGKDTKFKTLVLQMHFKYNGTYKGGSGLSMTVQDTPTPQVAGIYLMGTGGYIPAQSETYLETACEYSLPISIQPFAYRVHTHTFGEVVSGYRVRDDAWTEIGRKNPQLPQMFYPLTNPHVDIRAGDVLAARCTMKNDGKRGIMIGATKNDEMCNFYIMYAVPNSLQSGAVTEDADANSCFNDGTQYTKAEWLRDFGITSGFPAESSRVPATDVSLAKTMGDHMQMGNMQMPEMKEAVQTDAETNSDDELPNENEELYREFFDRYLNAEASNEQVSEESDSELNAMQKRYFDEYLAQAQAEADADDEAQQTANSDESLQLPYDFTFENSEDSS